MYMSAKDVKGKARLRLIPYKSIVAVSKVREFGIEKYGGDDENWKTVHEDDFAEATLRHIYKYFDGEIVDDESGLHHLHHAACSILLAIAVLENKRGK
jgi:hypothetical protein